MGYWSGTISNWITGLPTVSTLNIQPNVWYSYAAVYAPNPQSDVLYVWDNTGTLYTGTSTATVTTCSAGWTTGGWIIGSQNWGQNAWDDVQYFPGYLGGVKEWNELRNSAQAFGDIWATGTIPEPSTLVLLVSGLLGLLAYAWRKRR
jgi:hypothetical protein